MSQKLFQVTVPSEYITVISSMSFQYNSSQLSPSLRYQHEPFLLLDERITHWTVHICSGNIKLAKLPTNISF